MRSPWPTGGRRARSELHTNGHMLIYSWRMVQHKIVRWLKTHFSPVYAVKAYVWIQTWLYSFLNSSLDGSVVSFMLRPLYPWWKRQRLPSNKRLLGSQKRSGYFGVKENISRLPSPDSNTTSPKYKWRFLPLRFSFFWDVIQLWLLDNHRLFAQVTRPEESVTIYGLILHNLPEEQRSCLDQRRDGNLKSFKVTFKLIPQHNFCLLKKLTSWRKKYSGVTHTDMRRLTTGIRSEKCVVRRFRRCANVIECTYTNLDGTV